MIDASQPIRIDPDAIYDDAALVLLFGLTTRTLARERQAGRLRYTKRGRVILYRGDWVTDWLIGSSRRTGVNDQGGEL